MKDSHLLCIFGEPRLRDAAGNSVAFKTRRQLAVLCFLVLDASGRAVRRARIAELFWPDVDQERGAHSLSQAISDLRRVLGRDAIVSRDGLVSLRCAIETELEYFADEASSLAGLTEPLRGLEGLGGVSLSHWLDATRAELNARLRSTLQRGLADKQAGGDLEGARQRAELLYRADPLNDEAIVALAEHALLQGDPPGAIHLLRTHASRIKETCGGNPGADVVRLMRTLEGGEHRKVPQLSPIVHMVGRDREMALLQGVWSSIRNGGAVAALITGVPGIGKSTLIESFLHSVASRKWHCYSTRCHEMGRRIPYSAIADIVHLLASEPEVAGTDPVLLAEASRVAPELNAAYPGIPAPPRADPDSIRLRVAGALYQMLFEVTEGQPVLVTFDDIHNMDQASREVLYVLYHRMRSRSAMFLGSARSPEDGRVSSRSDVMDWQSVTELGPLDRARSSELLERIGGSLEGRTKQRILELGQDNPHLIEILVADSRENGEDALVEVSSGAEGGWRWRASNTMNRALAGLLFGLTAEAQRLLDVISIVERPIPVAEAAAITGTDETTADQAGFELIERGLVRFEARGLAIKNELHRLYIHSRMNPDIRRFLHARMVRHVTTAEGEESSLELVHHLLAADSVPEAIDKVVAAARGALAQGAPAEAKKAILAAATSSEIERNAQLSFLLAQAFVATGEYHFAIRILESPAISADRQYRGHSGRLLAEALYRGGRSDDGRILSLTQNALRQIRVADDPTEVANTLQLLAEVAFFTGDDAIVASAATHAEEIAQESDLSEVRGRLDLTNGFHALTAGNLRSAASRFEAARSHLELHPPDTSFRRAITGLGMCYTGLGRFPDAEEVLRLAISVSEQIGDMTGIGISFNNLGSLLFEMGRYEEATECFRRCQETHERHHRPGLRASYFSNAALLAIATGRLGDASELAANAEREATHSGSWQDQVLAKLANADYHLSTRNSGAAWSAMEEVRAICEQHPSKLAIDRGQLGRLTRHHTFATRGWEALRQEMDDAPKVDYCRVINRIEIQLFETWAAWHVGVEPAVSVRAKQLLAEALDLGLYGLLAKVHAIGVLPVSLGSPNSGESSAQLVERMLRSSRFPANSIKSRH